MSLVSIGAAIEVPASGAGHEAPQDRLEELAHWWSRVATSDTAVRASQLWAPGSFSPPATVEEVISWATEETDRIIDRGADVVLLSVPAGAIAASVLAARVLHLDAVDAAGWPADTGMSDQRWMVIVTTIRDGLRRVRGPLPDADMGESPNSDDVLLRLGDPALAAGCAVVLQSANRRTPLIVEGLAAAACGLFAHRVNPASLDWWQAADGPIGSDARVSGAPGTRDGLHDRILAAMHREPLLRLGLARADGTAARIALQLLEAAIARGTP